MALETAVEVGKFKSPRYPGLRLLRRQEYRVPNAWGQLELKQTGVRYEFEDGVLEIEAGTDVLPDGPGGEEQDALAWLRSHKGYQLDFHEIIEPTPREGDFMREVTRASIAMDDVSLQELVELEESGFRRPNLIEAAQNALEQVREAQQGDGPGSGEPS